MNCFSQYCVNKASLIIFLYLVLVSFNFSSNVYHIFRQTQNKNLYNFRCVRSHSSQETTCFHCGENFRSKSDLLQHSKTHTNTSPSTSMIPCVECGTPFNTPEALAVHVKLHTGDVSLMDDLCNITASLHNHTQNPTSTTTYSSVNFNLTGAHHHHHHHHHGSVVKKRNHVCEHCSKSFSSKHGFQQHQKRHPQGTCAQRSFVCEICKKAFFQRNHLQLHQRQHTLNNKEQSVCVTDMLSVKLDPEMESNSSASSGNNVNANEKRGGECDGK